MDRELDIINRLKCMGMEIDRQDNRSTSNPLWVDSNRKNIGDSKCFSFFESDVNVNENNYVISNHQAEKMNELRELILELATFL